jgi:transcriptional regulator GlxA family with amidase domain
MPSAKLHDLTNQPTDRFATVGNRKESTAAGLRPRGQPCGRTHDRRMLLVLMLVEESTRRQLLMGDIARAVNLSPGRLAHLFKSEMGVSPQRYLNSLRLEKAKEFLENGVLSVKEIASEVGIPNASRFCRSFKARYGATPKEYRKTHLRLDLESVAPMLRSSQNSSTKSSPSV